MRKRATKEEKKARLTYISLLIDQGLSEPEIVKNPHVETWGLSDRRIQEYVKASCQSSAHLCRTAHEQAHEARVSHIFYLMCVGTTNVKQIMQDAKVQTWDLKERRIRDLIKDTVTLCNAEERSIEKSKSLLLLDEIISKTMSSGDYESARKTIMSKAEILGLKEAARVEITDKNPDTRTGFEHLTDAELDAYIKNNS